MPRVKWVLFLFIILLSTFLRLYKLGAIPNGLYQDETAIGYNAYSILQTGKDEHGVNFPLYFKSFGDYKLPGYIYLATMPVKLLGPTEVAVRLPSALFGIAAVIVFYFLAEELTKNQNLALLASLFLAINPWHLHYSRATFEVSISLFLFLLGALFMLKFFSTKKPGLFLLGSLLFTINIYTYNLTRVLSPLLFILLIFFNRDKIKTISRFELFSSIFLNMFLLLPFIITFQDPGGSKSAAGTLIYTSAAIQAPILEYRSYLTQLPTFFTKLFFNLPLQTFWHYLNNLVSFLSPTFFFVSGSQHGNHGIGNVGQFYLFEFLFIFLGIFIASKHKEAWLKLLILWSIIVILLVSATREVPHATRAFFLLFPLTIFSAYGGLSLFKIIIKIKGFKKIIILGTLSLTVIYALIYYFTSYYLRFPIYYAKAWRSADKELSLFLKTNDYKYDKIIIDSTSGFIYTSLLFYSRYSPEEFIRTQKRTVDDSEGFSMISSFGKYEIREINWEKDLSSPRTLVITTANKSNDKYPPLKTFSYPMRPVVVAVKQELFRYPIEEIAYVAFETK